MQNPDPQSLKTLSAVFLRNPVAGAYLAAFSLLGYVLRSLLEAAQLDLAKFVIFCVVALVLIGCALWLVYRATSNLPKSRKKV